MSPKPPRRPPGKPTGKAKPPGAARSARAGRRSARDGGDNGAREDQRREPRPGPRRAGDPTGRPAGGPAGRTVGAPAHRVRAPERPENQGSRRDETGRRGRAHGAGPRPRSGEGWIYGHHAVAAALANPARRVERLVLTRDAEESLGRAGIGLRLSPEIRSAQEISALLPEGAAHQGFALRAAPLPEIGVADVLAGLENGAPALVVVLDQVTDPRNVGAILRSAAAFGATAVILPERHGADTTAALAKTASGALETVALARVTNISRTLEALKAGGFWCVGLDAAAVETLASVDLTGRVALVLGSEGSGLRRLVSDTCDIHARLPIGPGIESLNVAAAAAIAMYEVARRRG